MGDPVFYQEVAKALVQTAVPSMILIIGGRRILDRYQVARKKREQELELARFVRERQYEALQEIYDLFGKFMALYREINSKETNLRAPEVQRDVLARCVAAEARVEASILRIASEFTHRNRTQLEGFLANMRQSVQLWRETVREGGTLPFNTSEQRDYVRFKVAFSNTATYLASQIYQRLEAPEVVLDESQRLLTDIFNNKWESAGARAQ